MWPDVVDLRDFYASSLGQVTRRLVRRQIRAYWTDTTGMNVLGVGFATPFLLPFSDEAAHVTAVMPARMGVLGWSLPDGGSRNLVCLSDEGSLPFADLSMDRIVVVHGLEHTEQVSGLLRELWRVLADGGRLLVVVPNRRGTWAHADDTPFGHGHPYSLEQLNRTLRQSMFTPVRGTRALFLPPTRRRFWLAAAPGVGKTRIALVSRAWRRCHGRGGEANLCWHSRRGIPTPARLRYCSGGRASAEPGDAPRLNM